MNKTVMITAGAAHTGLETALKFAEHGYNVVITSRDLEKGEKAVELITSKYPDVKAAAYAMELTNVKSIEECFKKVREDFLALDVFVANAAHLGVGLDIYNTDEKQFDEVFDTNVKGTFFSCREAARIMNKNSSIVLLGSVQSKGAVEGRTVYGATKAAVSAFTKYFAYDLAPHGIRVNCVVSGAIHTPRWDELTKEELEKRRSNYPLGCESDMEDIANAIYYLATPLSKSVTGTELVIDSGVLVSILPYQNRKDKSHSDFWNEK